MAWSTDGVHSGRFLDGVGAAAGRPIAVALHSRDIAAEHILLGIVRAGGTATDILNQLGVSPALVRQRVQDLLRNAA